MTEILQKARNEGDLKNETCQILLENLHLYMNKLREFKEQGRSKQEVESDSQLEEINTAFLQLKRVLRHYEDALDDFELKVTPRDLPLKRREMKALATPPTKNLKSQEAGPVRPPKMDKTEEKKKERVDEINLLDLDVSPIPTLPSPSFLNQKGEDLAAQDQVVVPEFKVADSPLDEVDPFDKLMQDDFQTLMSSRNRAPREEHNFL